MSGLVLLIIGLACLALIVAVAAMTGLKVWRLVKHAAAVSRTTGNIAADLSGRARQLEFSAGDLQANVAQLQVNLVRLQVSAERLRILADAWNEAMAPYRSVRAFFGR